MKLYSLGFDINATDVIKQSVVQVADEFLKTSGLRDCTIIAIKDGGDDYGLFCYDVYFHSHIDYSQDLLELIGAAEAFEGIPADAVMLG